MTPRKPSERSAEQRLELVLTIFTGVARKLEHEHSEALAAAGKFAVRDEQLRSARHAGRVRGLERACEALRRALEQARKL
jgi:hypothetical protein